MIDLRQFFWGNLSKKKVDAFSNKLQLCVCVGTQYCKGAKKSNKLLEKHKIFYHRIKLRFGFGFIYSHKICGSLVHLAKVKYREKGLVLSSKIRFKKQTELFVHLDLFRNHLLLSPGTELYRLLHIICVIKHKFRDSIVTSYT